MSGNSFKCGLNRFDGHGNNYRSKDTTSSDVSNKLSQILADRDYQDALFSGKQCQLQTKAQVKTEALISQLPARNLPEISTPNKIHQSLPPWLVQQNPSAHINTASPSKLGTNT